MNLEVLFKIFNGIAIFGWIFLILSYKWKWAKTVAFSGGIILLLSGIYVFLILSTVGDDAGGFGSLEEVGLLFQNKTALLAGWVHYMAFDLLTGTWMLGNSQKHGIKFYWVIPCLILTLLYGPCGLLFYFILRSVITKRLFQTDGFLN